MAEKFETQTRAERLGLPVHKAKKNTKSKAKKDTKQSYFNWRDIQEIFEPRRDDAFAKAGMDNLANPIKKVKDINLAINTVNETVGVLEDEANGIRIAAVIPEAILSPKTGNIIFYIKGYTERDYDGVRTGESFVKYKIEYCDKDACTFEIIDSAFDALEGVVRRKYGKAIADSEGKVDDNLLLD